jgi:hypothetical protein
MSVTSRCASVEKETKNCVGSCLASNRVLRKDVAREGGIVTRCASFVCAHSQAEDTLTGKQVAIKKIANVVSDEADALATMRVLREIKLLRHFNHENVGAPLSTLASFMRAC